jgi:hypothetical protein
MFPTLNYTFKQMRIMRSIKILSLVIAATLVCQSCDDDFLVTVPDDRLSTELFWKTDNDAIYGANAVYRHLTEGAGIFTSWDAMTDIGMTHTPNLAIALLAQGQIDPLSTRVAGEWSNAYSGIRAANSFFANVDRVETKDPALIPRLKGEVKVIRAYLYTRLAALFGDVPLVTTEISLDESKNLERTPVSEVWDFISSELSEAADALPLTQKDVGRITKGAALALKARAMLWAGRYQEAADAASAVMGLNVYSLYPSYKDLFSYATENNQEVILDVQFIENIYANNMYRVLAPVSQNGSPQYFPTKNLVDSYEMTNGLAINEPGSGYDPNNPYTNRDPRLGYSLYTPGDILPDGSTLNPVPGGGTSDEVGSSFVVSETGFYLKKYVNAEDKSDPLNCGINIILIRYAEVLLTYAEAKIELNQVDASVYDAINQVRQRPDVSMPAITTGKSQDEMRQIVRQERLSELAFESQRFFDIRRWQIAGEVMAGRAYGITYEDGSGDLQTVTVPGWNWTWNDRNYLWPIPQTERELNSNLTQNPGY